ncbi:MAG TPA: FtsX-like permease family protein [Streptosporangiaceae bacterium]|nr:FtsX-like permease family protein [Streptosporangiaceae bacterium]
MRAAARWIRADLGARPGQALATVVVVAGVVAALLLSATLLEGALNPWRALFAQTRGADVWLRLTADAPAGSLASLTGVTGEAGPYHSAAATLADRGVKAPVELRAMQARLPAIGRPLVRQGSWLSPHAPAGVVLEASFAQSVGVRPGQRVVIDGLDGSSVPVRVAGLADTSDQGLYPDQAPGLVWGLPGLVSRVEPIARHTGQVIGLRLANRAATGFVVQQAVTRLGTGAVVSVSTWRDVEQSMARGDPLLGLLLAVFGLVALGAALLAIGNAAGGRVLIMLQDVAMLKTLGFTPRQVVGTLLAEHAVLGLAGVTAGLTAGRLLMLPLLHGLPIGTMDAVAPLPAGWVALGAAGTELAVLLATALPGWRAGRIWPVAAIRPPVPTGRLSRLARAAIITRLPPAVVLGTRAAFTRRLPAALTIGGLALPMAMITIGLGCWSTLDNMQHHPGQIGLAAALTVSPGEMSQAAAGRLVADSPDVAAAYRSVQLSALLPGETSTITTLGVGTSDRPYPFHVAAGRLYRAPGEAVASQGLLTAAHLQVGEYVRMPVGGVPVIVHLVGRIVEPEYSGQVLAFGIDTLAQAGAAQPPVSYSLVLRHGVSPVAARDRLLHASGGRLVVSRPLNPASSLGVLRVMLAGLFAVLALIGLTSLLVAAAVGLRDHLRDVGVLQAMGLTPRQVMAAMVTSTSVLALTATLTGAAAGTAASAWLINLGGRFYGIGAGIGSAPPAVSVVAAVATAVTVATLAAIIPARRAALRPVADLVAP